MLSRFECPYCHQEGWVEIEITGVEYELFDSFESAYNYILKYASITGSYRDEDVYREVAKFMIPKIRQGYDKVKLIEETSKLFGIVEEDVVGILERVKAEIGAYEEDGRVVV